MTKAGKTWNGKFVQFTATVSNITDSEFPFANIGSKQFSMAQISCRVKDTQQLLSLKNRESVTVKGIIGKQTIGVIDTSDCEVVKEAHLSKAFRVRVRILRNVFSSTSKI